MSDLSRVVSGYSQIGGLVWDSGQKRLFFTADGALNALDPLTGQVAKYSIPGAHRLGELDVSPDGRFVLIAENEYDLAPVDSTGVQHGYNTSHFDRLWLSDGHIDTFSFMDEIYYESGTFDVAILSSGKALLTTDYGGSGLTNLRVFTAAASSPEISDVTNASLNTPPHIDVSGSHRYALITSGNNSGGPLAIYDANAGAITAKAYVGQFPGHSLGAFLVRADISEAAGLVAVGDRDNSLLVTDLSLHLVKDLSFDFKIDVQGLHFSPDGKQLFVLQAGTNQIAVFDTHTWAQLGSVHTQSVIANDPFSRDGILEFSSDGRFLFVDTANGLEVLDLDAHPVQGGDGDLGAPKVIITDTAKVSQGESVVREDIGYSLENPGPDTAVVLEIGGSVSVSGAQFVRGAIVTVGNYHQVMVIDASGVLSVAATQPVYATAIGYYVPGFDGPRFINRGELMVVSASDAYGVRSFAINGDYANNGVIHVEATDQAVGVQLNNLESTWKFDNYGAVEVTGGAARGVVQLGHTSSFANHATGTIIATTVGGASQSGVGVTIEADGFVRPYGDTYTNAGLIQGGTALVFSQSSSDTTISYTRTFHNETTGVLRGDVMLSGNGIVMENAGLIDGAVTMGNFSEVYDGSKGGVVTGLVSGGAGDDQMTGGPGFDYFQGNTGNDDLRGGASDDWVVGGKDNDQLRGEAGDDIVYGNIGADTCDGGDGADIVRGGQDNDSLSGGAGDDFVSGDKGDDTVSGGAGADLFHTFGDAGIDRVLDFNRSERDRVMLDPGTQYTVAQDGADTVITMTGGAKMILVGVQLSTLTGEWIFGA